MQQSQNLSGIISAISAYILWGILPMYWKLLSAIPADEILAHRVIWSLFFMVLVIGLRKKTKSFLAEVCVVCTTPKKLAGVTFCAALITLNWFIYIWAVNENRVIETSLGYYINPLVSVLLGIAVLKEKLSFWQSFSVFFAAIGVCYMTLHFGSIPWVALLLAISFGLYGLFKKMIGITAITSVTLETILITPFASGYLYFNSLPFGSFSFHFTSTILFLMGTGVVTAIPLLLFANSTNHLSLTVLSFIQYLSPTIALVLGIFLYHEPFTYVHLISFVFIWLALFIFSVSKTSFFLKLESNLRNNHQQISPKK